MSNDDSLFFIVRKDEVWACWLDAKAPISVGHPSIVIRAMKEFLSGQDSGLLGLADRIGQDSPSAHVERPIIERAAERHDVSIVGRLRTTRGSSSVTIHDLSEGGCLVFDDLGGHSEGERVTIRIGSIGPISATIAWCSKQQLGLSFENALHSYIVDHMRTSMDLRI